MIGQSAKLSRTEKSVLNTLNIIPFISFFSVFGMNYGAIKKENFCSKLPWIWKWKVPQTTPPLYSSYLQEIKQFNFPCLFFQLQVRQLSTGQSRERLEEKQEEFDVGKLGENEGRFFPLFFFCSLIQTLLPRSFSNEKSTRNSPDALPGFLSLYL